MVDFADPTQSSAVYRAASVTATGGWTGFQLASAASETRSCSLAWRGSEHAGDLAIDGSRTVFCMAHVTNMQDRLPFDEQNPASHEAHAIHSISGRHVVREKFRVPPVLPEPAIAVS